VKLNEWDRDGARRRGRGADRDEDLVRTVALGGEPTPAGALDETLPMSGDGRRPGRAHTDAAGPAWFDGAQHGRFRMGEPPEPFIELAGPPAGAGRSSGRTTRRVLFAAAGLSLVAAGGYAATRAVRNRGARLAAASGPGSASSGSGGLVAPLGSPQPSQSASGAGAAPSASAGTPGDVSSSSAAAGASPSSPPSSPSASAGSAAGSGGPGAGGVHTQPEYYIQAGPKMIALTLDDGPNSVYTPQVLDLLAQYKISATFCMIGEQIAANASLVREVAAAGHAIVNHTWNHADQSKLSLSAVRSQIQRANDALANVGVHPAIFRAPYGAWSPTVFQACADANLRPLDWSVDPQDWARPGTSTIVSRIMKNTRTGSIILEHDGGGDRSQTVAALKIVLPQLLDAGYRFTGV
jgi:peptidoglycan/xylan/chitin deacetylase (PgdA/CDA1 family)